MPFSAHLLRHGGLLVAPRSVAGSTVAYDTLQTERHLWYCERWFQLPWCDQPALKRVCIGQAAFHSTGLASASRSSADVGDDGNDTRVMLHKHAAPPSVVPYRLRPPIEPLDHALVQAKDEAANSRCRRSSMRTLNGTRGDGSTSTSIGRSGGRGSSVRGFVPLAWRH